MNTEYDWARSGAFSPGSKDLLFPFPHGGGLLGVRSPLGWVYAMADTWLVNFQYGDLGLGLGFDPYPNLQILTLVYFGAPGPHFGLASLLRVHTPFADGTYGEVHMGPVCTVGSNGEVYPGLVVGLGLGRSFTSPSGP